MSRKNKARAINHGKDYNYFNNGKEDIRTGPSSKSYREGYDRIFGKKNIQTEKKKEK